MLNAIIPIASMHRVSGDKNVFAVAVAVTVFPFIVSVLELTLIFVPYGTLATDVGLTVPRLSPLAIVTVYVFVVLVKFAVTVVAPVTVAVPFVQLLNAYVYCASEAVGVAVTSVPLIVTLLPELLITVP